MAWKKNSARGKRIVTGGWFFLLFPPFFRIGLLLVVCRRSKGCPSRPSMPKEKMPSWGKWIAFTVYEWGIRLEQQQQLGFGTIKLRQRPPPQSYLLPLAHREPHGKLYFTMWDGRWRERCTLDSRKKTCNQCIFCSFFAAVFRGKKDREYIKFCPLNFVSKTFCFLQKCFSPFMLCK